jgi:exodeoxyribonuclease VII small subunit
MAEEKIEFEKSLKRLEEIVAKVEGETLPLEESLKLYEEGKKLIASLEKTLKEAERKVEELQK